MNMDLELYKKLFVHRDDVFAQQLPDGSYRPIHAPLTDDDLREHLAGLASYGTYTIRPSDNTVKFMVFDLDTNEGEDLQKLVEAVNALLGPLSTRPAPFHQLVEVSGRKGWHVWVFFSDPLPAAQVRRWLAADFQSPVPGLEVFPKQDKVPEGSYGNLVKLPFGVHAVTGNRSLALYHSNPMASMLAVPTVSSNRVPDYPETTKVHGPGTTNREGGLTPFSCVNKIMEGVGEGNRDNAMFHLAAYWKGHGLEQDLAFEACIRCNELFDPPLDEEVVHDKVSSAYGGSTRKAGCGADWLKGFCPGPCPKGREEANMAADSRNSLVASRNELAAWLAESPDKKTIMENS